MFDSVDVTSNFGGLISLNLSSTFLGNSGFIILCRSFINSGLLLKELKLNECYLGDKGFSYWEDMIKRGGLKYIEELSFNENNLTDTTMSILSASLSLFPRKYLKKLCFRQNKLTNEGVELITMCLSSHYHYFHLLDVSKMNIPEDFINSTTLFINHKFKIIG